MVEVDEDQKRTWSYFGYFFKFSVISWILRDFGAPLLKQIPGKASLSLAFTQLLPPATSKSSRDRTAC